MLDKSSYHTKAYIISKLKSKLEAQWAQPVPLTFHCELPMAAMFVNGSGQN